MNSGCSMPNDFIDIVGLCDWSDELLPAHSAWTEISVPETLVIPRQKPDIEQVNTVTVCAKVIRKKVILTPAPDCPCMENFEGKKLTGKKLIVEGELLQTVNYTAAVCEQSVHSAHFIVPFSAFIVVPEEKKEFEVTVCVEDVFIKAITPREIFKNVTLLLVAMPLAVPPCPNEE